jgi:hypothetical protein
MFEHKTFWSALLHQIPTRCKPSSGEEPIGLLNDQEVRNIKVEIEIKLANFNLFFKLTTN